MLKRRVKQLLDKIKGYISILSGKNKIVVSSQLKQERVILLVSETNVPRIERMVYYLQSKRTEKIIFICSENKFKKEFFNRCPNLEVILIKYHWQIGYVMKQFNNIALVHTFESRSIFPYYAIENAPRNTPTIFDFQDLYTNYTGDKNLPFWMKENLWYEKKCLQKCDAYIAYSLELIPVRKKLNLTKRKSLYFPFYLDDAEIKNPSKSKDKNTINIVYAGGIAAIDRNISFNMTLTEQKIRGSNIVLHVYPSPLSGDEVIQSYFEYAIQHPNLQMHNPVNNNEMSAELNQYDFGIVPFFKTLEYQSADKYRYSSALKIFNYFEAGLPVIIASDVDYQAWLIKHHNCGVVIESENFAQLSLILQQHPKSEFSAALLKMQQTQRLGVQIEKINQLYNQLISE